MAHTDAWCFHLVLVLVLHCLLHPQWHFLHPQRSLLYLWNYLEPLQYH
jgi:hypothetical protein